MSTKCQAMHDIRMGDFVYDKIPYPLIEAMTRVRTPDFRDKEIKHELIVRYIEFDEFGSDITIEEKIRDPDVIECYNQLIHLWITDHNEKLNTAP